MLSIDLYILFFMSVLTFALFGWDKHKAVYGKSRIPEFLLLSLSLLGGAFGGLCGMILFRHKTMHTSFKVCVPLFMALQLIFHIFFRVIPFD